MYFGNHRFVKDGHFTIQLTKNNEYHIAFMDKPKGDIFHTVILDVILTYDELQELVNKALVHLTNEWANQPGRPDTTDPDNDFPDIPVYTDADAPEGGE